MNGLNNLTSKWKGNEDSQLLVLGGMYVAYSMFAGTATYTGLIKSET